MHSKMEVGRGEEGGEGGGGGEEEEEEEGGGGEGEEEGGVLRAVEVEKVVLMLGELQHPKMIAVIVIVVPRPLHPILSFHSHQQMQAIPP